MIALLSRGIRAAGGREGEGGGGEEGDGEKKKGERNGLFGPSDTLFIYVAVAERPGCS